MNQFDRNRAINQWHFDNATDDDIDYEDDLDEDEYDPFEEDSIDWDSEEVYA